MTAKWIEYGVRFFVNGTPYFDLKGKYGGMCLGAQIRFVGNPSNQYDSRAIRVMYGKNQLGWVPKDSVIQHGLWAEHDAGFRIIGVITAMRVNVSACDDLFQLQALVLKPASGKKLSKPQADIHFAQMKEELSYMVK